MAKYARMDLRLCTRSSDANLRVLCSVLCHVQLLRREPYGHVGTICLFDQSIRSVDASPFVDKVLLHSPYISPPVEHLFNIVVASTTSLPILPILGMPSARYSIFPLIPKYHQITYVWS
jgi:hypothetical protein